jgi:hypothetical protein
MATETLDKELASGGGGNFNGLRPVADDNGGEYGGPDRRRGGQPTGYIRIYGNHPELAGRMPEDILNSSVLRRRRTDAPFTGSVAIEGFKIPPEQQSPN